MRLVLFCPRGQLASGTRGAQTNSFAHPEIAREAQRYEAELATKTATGSRPQQDLIAYGKRALSAGDARAAAGAFAQAAVLTPENAESWLLLAGALLETSPDPDHPSERYDLPANASAAVCLAYKRATSPAVEAQAWQWHGRALERRSFWRPALDAFKSSLSIAEDPEVRQAYETLRAEHGFRLVGYTVEQDVAQPRLCLQFFREHPARSGSREIHRGRWPAALHRGSFTRAAVSGARAGRMTPEPPIARNLEIERAFYSLDGTPIELGSAVGGAGQVRQTNRFAVVLKVEADVRGRILLVDRLPAGLEIENPRLIDSADLKSFPWLRASVQPQHTEFRDDRFVAAFDLGADASQETGSRRPISFTVA